MRRGFITLLLLLAGRADTPAQDWGKAMFDHTSHDFGVVARGQKVEHRFPIENIYLEDVLIESLQSTCGCTIPKVTQKTLKTYDQAAIVAEVDTRNFLARKDATLRVSLKCLTEDGPRVEEVQLHCYVYIRSDVVLEPGEIRFASVPHGTALPPKKISIACTGRNDWKILRPECRNPHLELQLIEKSRSSGQVTYDLSVALKPTAPVGYLREHVVLVTNDPDANAARLLIPVEGRVTPMVSARPSLLMLGLLNPGQQVARTLMVRGNKPFRILKVSGPDERFKFKWADDARTLNMIRVTFTAAQKPGRMTGTIRVQTDVAGDETVEVKFDGQVVAPSPQDDPKTSPQKDTAKTPEDDPETSPQEDTAKTAEDDPKTSPQEDTAKTPEDDNPKDS